MSDTNKSKQQLLEEIASLREQLAEKESSWTSHEDDCRHHKSSLEFFQSTIDALVSHIAILDERAEIVYVNQSWRRFADENGLCTSHYCLGMNYLSICQNARGMFCDEAKEVANAIHEIVEGKRDFYRLEYPCHSPIENRWFVLRLTRFMSEGFVYIIADHINITERKENEMLLLESEQRFHDVALCSADFIWEVDIKACIIYVSGRVKDVLGYEPDKLIGTSPYQFIVPEYREQVSQVFQHAVANKEEIKNFESWNVTKDGRLICLLTNGTPILDANGQVTGFRGVNKDITKQKAAEKELKKKEELLFATQKMAKVGGWELDVETKDLIWTDEVRRIHEVPMDYTPQLDDAIQFYAPEYRQTIEQAVHDSFTFGKSYDVELQLITAKGKRIWVRSMGQCERVNGKVVKLFGTFQNIDKSKRVENALKNSQHKLVAQRRIATAFLTTKGDEVYAEVLNIVLEYLQSKYGFFGYINGQGDLVSPSLTRDIWSECQVEEKSIVFPRAQWVGLWGDSLKQKKSLHSNQSLSPPQGHVPLFCALAVPILYHEELIGQIVVANKEDGYSEEDINQLEAIAKHISPILNARLEAVKSEKGKLIAEKALQESEERYREFVEGTDNLITQVNAEGKFTFVNYVAQNIYEMDPSDCIGKSAFDFIHPDDRQRTEETFLEWLRTQTKHATFENRQLSKSGIVRNLLWSIHLKYDENDNLLYINSIAQNITDLRKAEEALRQAKEELEVRVFERTLELNTINEELTQEIQERIETELRLRNSEKRYRELYEGSRDGIAFTDLEGKITRFNNSFREILGYSEEELYALNYQDLTPADWHEMEANILQNEVLRYGYSPLYEKEYISKDGSIITVEIRTYMLRDENYKHIGFWAFVRDITDRKQAEEQLRFQEERLKLALEATSDGLWDWHVQKEEVYFSPRYYTMLGYEPYELPSTFDTWLNLLHPEDKEQSVRKIKHHLTTTRDEFDLEFRLKTKKSRWRWIYARGKVVERDEENRPIRMIGTHEDITSRKKTENALKERVDLLELAREIGMALTKKESLDNTLQLCCESVVKHLDFLFTRIWLIDEKQAILILRASAGLYTHLNGEHSRIPLGQLKIGRIGEQNESMVINDLQEKGTIIDLEWAARENIQAFAGYPITIADKVVGVIAMFSQKPISPMIHNSLESITNHIAIGIQRFIADEALRSSEEKYRLVSENIPVVVYSALPDEGSTSTFISGQIKELTGYTETEFLNDPDFFSKILHEDDRDFVWEHIQRHRQNKDPLNLQYRMVTKSGEVKWIRDKATVLLDESRNMIQINGFMEDITEQKKAEQALVTKSRELEEVFNAIPDAVVYADTERRIIKVNPGFTYLFGYQPEDVLGQKTQILYADTEQFHNQGKQRYNPEAKGSINPFEMNYKKKNGDIFISETVGTPVRDAMNRPLGYLGIIRDISERKQKENEIHRLNEELEHRVHERTAQLQAANKELEAFSYSISHDLRAPLRAIDGFSRALQEDFSEQLNDEGQMYIERVRRNAQRMAGLIDDILKLSRMSRAEIRTEQLDLSALAESILQELQDADAERNVKWTVAPNITAKGDERMIRLVLENLLGNAWKFTSKHSSPHIEFRAMKEHGKQTYSVIDNGAGFDMAYADKLFGAFQRLHSTEEYEGTGIGLATVQRIINRHGGQVWAEGKVGEGAAFYFTLPK